MAARTRSASLVRLALRVAGSRIARAPLGPRRALSDLVFGLGPTPSGVDRRAGTVGGVTGAWLTPRDAASGAVLLFIHGGAYTIGSSHSHHRAAAHIALAAGLPTFVPDYRLAPEHRFPAAFEDIRAAYEGLLADGYDAASIAVAGDSCGGGMALALAQHLRDAGKPLPGVVGLMCPWLDLEPDIAGTRRPAPGDPLNLVAVLKPAAHEYLAGADPTNPLASPLRGGLAGLPPVVLTIATDDPTTAEAKRLTRKLRQMGGELTMSIVEKAWHGFYLQPGLVAAADEALRWFGRELSARLPHRRRLRVGIIGAGMSGLCMAARLQEVGLDDFVIYEKGSEVGGTWRENRYPGLTCDVPSRFYCYSFSPNPNWSQLMSPGSEILSYFKAFADQRELRRSIRFNSEVTDARWNGLQWDVLTADGHSDTFDALVTATGFLHHPKAPEIAGIDSFTGIIRHSARWDESIELHDKRVGIIGTGSTGTQLTTAIAQQANHVSLFQRTPQWVVSLPNHRYGTLTRALFRNVPAANAIAYGFYQRVMEGSLGVAAAQPGIQRTAMSTVVRLSLRLGVKDPELRAKLTPDYAPLCKRIVVSGTFYETMQKDHVDLVTERIDRIEPGGVVTGDGVLHELDVLVLATGFEAQAYMRPMEITGVDGLTLTEAWADGPSAYRTIAAPGFPNMFTLVGPHSPVGNISIICVAETQTKYVMQCLDRVRQRDTIAIVPKASASDAYNAERELAAPNTAAASGCSSWYLGADGKPAIWPWTPARFHEMLSRPAFEEFELLPAAVPALSTKGPAFKRASGTAR